MPRCRRRMNEQALRTTGVSCWPRLAPRGSGCRGLPPAWGRKARLRWRSKEWQGGPRPSRSCGIRLRPLPRWKGDSTLWGQLQQAFASPDTHHSNALWLAAVADAERKVDQLSEEWLAELGHHPTDVGVRQQVFQPIEDLGDEPVSHFGDALVFVPDFDVLEVVNGGLRESKHHGRHGLLHAESRLRLLERDLPSLIEIGKALHDRA